VVHGDEMDAEMRCGRWLKFIGSIGYRLLMHLNRNICRVRSVLGLPYWSLAAHLKKRVGTAVEYMQRFEQGMVEMARRVGADGVVCGHIHHAAIKRIGETLYCNDGDWVESCTAVVEQSDGQLSILRWADIEQQRAAAVTAAITKQAA
jgi:UDP-2,3-diacylglucosamine pyrophosphatase LpxH